MFHTMLQFCKKEKLIEEGDQVLAGVSGGADSVCLLLLLKQLQRELSFSLAAVHVEHGIRGAESEADAVFVAQLCKAQGVPLKTFSVQAALYAKEQRLGVEEAARLLRYDCYKQAAEQMLLQAKLLEAAEKQTFLEGEEKSCKVKIALAHHADDNAETVLFQMIRGSGLDGLCGMQPKRSFGQGIEVIRPLLCVTRVQIEQYLNACSQSYCVDSTNADIAYSRNRLRREVLPQLSAVNAQAIAHINQSAAYLQETADYVKEQVNAAAKLVFQTSEQGLLVRKEAYDTQPKLLQRELLYLALTRAAGAAKDIGAAHVAFLAELFTLQVGRKIFLPYGVCAKRVYEGVLLRKEAAPEAGKHAAKQKREAWQRQASVQKNKAVQEQGVLFSMEKEELDARLKKGSFRVKLLDTELCFSLSEKAEISKNTYTKCFDYDKIGNSFQIRTRCAGDYLVIDEDGHRKRLKEYFINEKIPQEQRDGILLFTEGSKVIWVLGRRMSADAKISERTTKILRVQILGGKYHEN